MRSLSVTPKVHKFNSSGLDAFQKELERIHKNSNLVAIGDVREVLIDDTGRTEADGYRFSDWALYQLCQGTCSGLHRVVNDLLTDESSQSLSIAVSSLRNILRARFDRLYGKKLIIDESTGVVDGIVGSGYRWLPSEELHKRISFAVQHHGVIFLGAVIVGRWLMLRYRRQHPSFSFGNDLYYAGYHFSNNEAGASSIRAAGAIFRDKTWTAAIQPMGLKNKVPHRGNSFEAKLQRLLQKIDDSTNSGSYEDFFQAMEDSRIFAPAESFSRQAEKMEKVSLRLKKLGVGHTVAQKAVHSCVLCGSDNKAVYAGLEAVPPAAWEDRSLVDLYNSLGNQAKQLSIPQRERVEQAAYRILAGRY